MLLFSWKFLMGGLVIGALMGESWAEPFSDRSHFEVCFSPQQNCVQAIMQQIQGAQREILIQMYVFTNWQIIKALIAAQQRGVIVKIILDANSYNLKSKQLQYLLKHRILVKFDLTSGLAHNKIMILDRQVTIGGSFNYTKRAQAENEENVTVIDDARYTKRFVQNWQRCFRKAVTLSEVVL